MNRRIEKFISIIMVVSIILFAFPMLNHKVNAAGDLYESSWKEYNLGSANKGYYLEPADDGKYPTLIFLHGSGGPSDIPKDTLRRLMDYWVTMGYVDKMVIILPTVETGTAPSIYEAFRYWGQNSDRSGLLGQTIKSGAFSQKIDTSADIYVTGLSCGAAASLAAGISFKQYYSQVGAFSSFQGLYLGEKKWGWFNYASELTFADNADVWISYGDGEVDPSYEKNFKTTSELYANSIIANNNATVSVSLHSFNSSYGGHAWRLFSAELFAYLYDLKHGELPSDALISSAFNVPSVYSVSFNVNGHGIAPATQTVYSGSRIVRPIDPSASGFSFGGWFTDSSCTNAYDFSKGVTSNLTLYSKWTPDKAEPSLTGTAHVQDVGDQTAVIDNGTLKLGTRGRSLRMESVTINLTNNTGYSGDMEYRVHIQNVGWTDWMRAGSFAGTRGQSLRLEAIEIRLTGELAKHYSVEYCAHIQDYGDAQGWVRDGALAGTTGESKRIEEIKVRIVPIGRDNTTSVNYRVHVQDYGWENKYVADGAMSGTSGQSKRLEGIEIHLSRCQYTGGIRYRTHIQNIGWESTWARDGEMSGTQGKALRLEAIQIELYGDMAAHYDIYYRVHAQDIGWMSWASNGAEAGTAARSARLEGIQIVLVPKGSAAPGKTYQGITAVDSRAFVNGF